MKSNFNTNKWFKNQYLKENNNHVLSPQEYLKEELPHVYYDGKDIDYLDVLQAMEEYAKYISDWEINNYRQNIER